MSLLPVCPLFDARVSGIIGFCFHLFPSQSGSQLSPYQFLVILNYLSFLKKKKEMKKKKNVVFIQQCLH